MAVTASSTRYLSTQVGEGREVSGTVQTMSVGEYSLNTAQGRGYTLSGLCAGTSILGRGCWGEATGQHTCHYIIYMYTHQVSSTHLSLEGCVELEQYVSLHV